MCLLYQQTHIYIHQDNTRNSQIATRSIGSSSRSEEEQAIHKMQVIQNPEDQATPHQQVVRQSLKTSIYSYSKSMPQHMHRRLSQE
jgi:hypothetical protein